MSGVEEVATEPQKLTTDPMQLVDVLETRCVSTMYNLFKLHIIALIAFAIDYVYYIVQNVTKCPHVLLYILTFFSLLAACTH